MAGCSPAQPGRRRRARGWSTPSKASSRRPKSPTPSSAPPAAQLPPLPPGTEVEVRVDDDGFHGSWFEATVDGFIPARGRGSRARYTVTYAHLLSDDSGATLVEPFAPSRIRPRPPAPSSPEPLGLHDIVEAFHNDGWWSGIVLATDPLTVAFPITREVITFQEPRHVRPRRDYVDGRWVSSRAAIAVQPKRAVRVYEVGDKVEVVRDREVYGRSWFPATVAKVIDGLSYLVEYFDLEVEGAEGKAMEYLHCLFIRPAVEHSPRESEFRLGPGAAVEAYCDGAWSPGVVRRVVGDGEYEVSIDGKEAELLLKKVPELLKPQYKWDGKHWRIVSPKRQGNRRQSVSGKRPSSPVEVASSDDEHRHHTESSARKRSRKEPLQKKLHMLTEDSEHELEPEMNTTLSALRKSLASNHSPKSCSPLSGKNNFQVLSQRVVSICAVPKKGCGLLHASSEHPSPQKESRADSTGEVVNQEVLSDMMLSDGQLNTPVCGTSADEAHDILLTAGLKHKMDSSCINNSAQQTQQRPLFVQALQAKKYPFKHKGGEMHPIQALEGNSDASDNVQIQLKGNNNISSKEIICALSAYTCNTPSLPDKRIRAPDAVSRGAGSGPNTEVLTSKKSAKTKGFKDSSSPHASLDATSIVQKRDRKKVAGRLKESFVERLLERRGLHTQQQLIRNLEDTMNVNRGTNQEVLPLISPGFEDSSSPHASLDAISTVQKRGRKKVAGRPKESSVESLLERRGLHTQQQLNRNLEDTMNVNGGTNQEVLPLVSPGFKDSSSPHVSLDATSTVQKRGRKKVAGRPKESSVKSLLERRGLHTQLQLNRNLEDTMNVNRGTNQEVLPLISPSFKDSSSPHASLDATSTVQKRGRKKVAGRLKESSVNRLLERRELDTQQQLNRSLEDTMNVNRGTNQEVLPLISPGFESICNGQGFLDGGKVDERPIQLDFQNAGSSQCTIDDTILRSCSVAGSSLPSTLPSCQNLAEQVLFMKTSPVWHLIETMKVFREVPQQPHFLPLQQFMPELREGMALGLMVTYANLVESVKKSCISDSVALFERKISALAHLEDNGFDVKFLQHSLNKLLQTKCDHTKHLGHVDQLKELVPGKESAVSRKHALLDEKDKAIFQLEQELECLRGEAEQIARETKDEDAELLRLKAEVNIAQEACGDDELRFHSILAELRSRLQLSD